MSLAQLDGSCVSYLTGLGRSHTFSDSFSKKRDSAHRRQDSGTRTGQGRTTGDPQPHIVVAVARDAVVVAVRPAHE